MSDTNPLEYRVGVTVEDEHDQNRTNTRRLAPRNAEGNNSANFQAVAEKFCTLSSIEHAADEGANSQAIRSIKRRKRSKKAVTPGFPNRNSPFAFATG